MQHTKVICYHAIYDIRPYCCLKKHNGYILSGCKLVEFRDMDDSH